LEKQDSSIFRINLEHNSKYNFQNQRRGFIIDIFDSEPFYEEANEVLTKEENTYPRQRSIIYS